MKRRIQPALVSVSIISLLACSAAWAQVDEIVVTAQKRQQNLQDVPVAVTVLTAAQLANSGVDDIKDLISITPGLMVTSTANEYSTTVRIRGVGTVGDNPGLESSVGVFIDGVYRPRNGVSFGDLGELERVEVLRGPQGTVFGKNTSAGVLNIMTKAPTYENQVGGSLLLGNFSQVRADAYINGGESDRGLAFRLYAAHGNRDGFQDVVVGAGPRDRRESYVSNFQTIRGQLLWEPNEDLKVRLIADASQRDDDCCTGVGLFTSPTQSLLQAANNGVPGQLAVANPEARITFSNRSTEQHVDEFGFSAQADYQRPYGTWTSITSYREFEADIAQDVDFSSADIVYRDADENGVSFETFTQELRLAGSHQKLDWLLGFFYAHEGVTRRDAIRNGSAYGDYLNTLVSASSATGPNPNFFQDNVLEPLADATGVALTNDIFPLGSGVGGDEFEQNAETFALFTNNTYNFSSRLFATFGLRYTTEKKDVTSTFRTESNSGCGFYTEPQSALGGATGSEALSIAAPALAPTLAGLQPTYCLYWNDQRYDSIPYDFSRTDREFTGTAKLSYRLTPRSVGFVSYARGFKAGGFNLDRDGAVLSGIVPDTSFQPEIIDNFEIGLKSRLFERQLMLNATAFYQDIQDFQLNTYTGTRFIVANVPGALSKGVEVDAQYAPVVVPGFSVTAGAAWVDATYDDNLITASTPPDQVSTLTPLPGQQMTLSPEFYGNLAVTYERPLSDQFVGTFHLEGRYVTEYNTGSDLDPEKLQEAFGVVNGRIRLRQTQRNWHVELFGQNILDQFYNQVIFDAPLQSGAFNTFPGAPRTWGFLFGVDFK